MGNYSSAIADTTLQMLNSWFERTEGMISFEESVLLYRLAVSAKGGGIVEIGSYRGRSAVFLARGSLDGARLPVYAVDPHKAFTGVLGGMFGPADRTAFYRAMLDNECSEIVSLINLSSESFASTWKEAVSLLWVDGDHRYEGVRRDVECWVPHLQSDGVIAFDDALDGALGPRRLIDEMTASAAFVEIGGVGKIVVIKRCE